MSSPVHYKAFDFADDLTIYHRRLPHWRQEGCAYFVTFRLADSIPQPLVREWDLVRQGWLANHPRPWTEETFLEYERTFTIQMEEYLHAGHGKCILKYPGNAAAVRDSLLHFNGERYDLGNFVIMPNHVHAIVKPYDEVKLEAVLGACKGFTAHEINKNMNRSGRVWSEESYDHIIRHGGEMLRIARYICANPAKAGLSPEATVGGGATADWICDPPHCQCR